MLYSGLKKIHILFYSILYTIPTQRDLDSTGLASWLGSSLPPSPPPTCFTHSRSSKVGPAMQLVHSRVHKTTYAPMIYTALCVMFLMRADIRWGSGGGVGAGNLEFCWPQMALAYRLVPFHRAQNSRFPAPTPPPLPHLISARIKNITHGAV